MGNARRLQDGRWEMRVEGQCPRTGKRVTKRRRFRTKREAEAAEVELRAEIAAGPRREPTTLGDLARQWIESRGPDWTPRTMEHNATTAKLHILPHFGSWRVGEIRRSDVLAWRDEQRRTTYQVPRRALPGTKVRRVLPTTHAINGRVRVLSSLLGFALERELIESNPCAAVKALPTDRKPKAVTADELGRLLRAAWDSEPDYAPLITLLAYTGLRWGEASALQWGDIDSERGVIHVRRALSGGEVSTTKTGTHRTVALVPPVADALAGLTRTSVWVFPGPKSGRPIRSGGRYHAALQRIRRRAGVKSPVTFHGLRHTFNNLVRQASSETVARSLTGHSTESMTEHYSHVGDDEKLAAVLSIVGRVGG